MLWMEQQRKEEAARDSKVVLSQAEVEVTQPEADGQLPPRRDETIPDSGGLGMVKRPEAYAGLAQKRGPLANSLGVPDWTLEGSGGPGRFLGRVIQDKKTWDALWRSVRGHDIPEVDFGRHMAVALFAGEQPLGTRIGIVSAREKGGRFVVKYFIRGPDKDEGPGTARPYQVRVFGWSDRKPTFVRVKADSLMP